MIYDITYEEMSDIFLGRMKTDKPQTGEKAANSWLPEFDESTLEEAERLNVILPLIKWCVEHNCLTNALQDELFLYYEDYTSGKLEGILADYEASDVISDLTECYKKVFM